MSKNCIIILNYNDGERAEKLVREIAEYSSLEYILVVDNCSTDDSFARLKELASDKIHVIQTEKNSGYAGGNNFGAKYATKMWNVNTLYFANTDVFFEEDVIRQIEKDLWQYWKNGVATVLVRDGYNVWDLPGYWGTVRMLFLVLFTLHKRKIRNKMIKSEGCYEAGVVEGSFFAIKASVFDEIGGFDERTFLYLEENILAYKLHRHGYKEIVDTNMSYIHEHSRSISKEYKSKARAFRLFEPSFFIYLKYYLRCNTIQQKIFKLFYLVAYFERMIYDVMKYIIRK